MCAVFAETEIIGLLASGVRREDIVAGVQQSIAARISAMAGGELAAPVAFTGGVAMVAGMGKALSVVLGQEVIVPPDPQFTGALGAALLACAGLGFDPWLAATKSNIPADRWVVCDHRKITI